MPEDDVGGRAPHTGRATGPELLPREFLRVIAVWSLIPSYLLAGALIGYAADKWLGLFPYLTGVGLLLALLLATRDMLRLRDMM